MAAEKDELLDKSRMLGDPSRDHYRISASTVDMTRPAPKTLVADIAAQPQNIRVDLRKTALIVVDMQNDFCSKNGWFDSLGVDLSGVAKLYEPIRRTVGAIRAREIPIIWLNWGVRADKANLSPVTRYAFDRVGCGVGLSDPVIPTNPNLTHLAHGVLQKDGWGAAVVEPLNPSRNDIFVDKHRISGFWDTPLDSILRTLNAKTLFFAGINADECVLATLMDANFHGYDTILIEDCTGTSSPDYCMQATLYNVRFCFGFTVTSTDLIPGLAKAS